MCVCKQLHVGVLEGKTEEGEGAVTCFLKHLHDQFEQNSKWAISTRGLKPPVTRVNLPTVTL